MGMEMEMEMGIEMGMGAVVLSVWCSTYTVGIA